MQSNSLFRNNKMFFSTGYLIVACWLFFFYNSKAQINKRDWHWIFQPYRHLEYDGNQWIKKYLPFQPHFYTNINGFAHLTNKDGKLLGFRDDINYYFFKDNGTIDSVEIPYYYYKGFRHFPICFEDNFFFVFNIYSLALDPKASYYNNIWVYYEKIENQTIKDSLKPLFNKPSEHFTCVRHANGRDWWVIGMQAYDSVFHAFLFNQEGPIYHRINPFSWNNYPVDTADVSGGDLISNHKGNLLCSIYSKGTARPTHPAYQLWKFDRRNGKIEEHTKPGFPMSLVDSLQNRVVPRKPGNKSGYFYRADFDEKNRLYFPLYHSYGFGPVYFTLMRINDPYNQPFTYEVYDTLIVPHGSETSSGFANGVKYFQNKLYVYFSRRRPIYDEEFGERLASDLWVIDSLDKPMREWGINTNIDTSFFQLINFDYPFQPIPYFSDGYGLVNVHNTIKYGMRPDIRKGFRWEKQGCSEEPCGAKVSFTDTSSGHFYRLWDFGDGTKSDTLWVTQHAELLGLVDTFKTVTHTYTRPGRYKVTLQILNPYDYGEHLPPGQFLKDTLEQWIDVPFCSKAEFTAQSVCGLTVMIQDKHCGGYDTLLYDYGDGSPLTLSNTHTYTRPGVYYVTQILKLDTFISTFTAQVVVPDCIYPDVSLNDTLCVFDTLKITYTGTNNYDTLWYSVEPVQGVQNIWQNLVSFEQSGQYRLWLHAANSTFDTTWIYSDVITVLDCDELWIPNAFTPNNDGINDVFSYVCRNCVWNSLEIFNRDTQPIFRCEGSEACIWLGKTEKGLVPEGVYVYRLKVRKRDGREVERVGTVTVMR